MPAQINTFRKSAFLAIFSMAFLLTPLAYADKGLCDDSGNHSKDAKLYNSIKKIKADLNLTEEQKTKLKSMHKVSKETLKTQRDDLDKAQADIEAALKSDTSDEKIREKFVELQKLQSAFAKSRLEIILHIRSVLTPEQRAKFKNAIGQE